MSQGRPSNPSKGTQRPGEARPREADKQSAKPAAPDNPAGPSNPSPASGTAPAAGGSQSPGQPQAAKPDAGKPGSGKPDADKAAGGKPGTPAAAGSPTSSGGRPNVSSTGGAARGGPGGSGSGGSGQGGSGSGGSGSGGKPPPAAAPAQAPSRGGGYVAGIVGGVVGAALAVFGAPLVQGPPPLSPEADSRVAAIETDVDSLSEGLSDLQTLADELEPTVRTAVEEAVAEVPSRDGEAIAALAEDFAARDERLTAIETALEALDERATEMGEQLTAAREEAVSGLEAAREDAVSGLEAAREDAVSGLEAAREEAVSGLDERLTAAAKRIDALDSELQTGLDAVRGETTRMVGDVREAASGEVAMAEAAIGGQLVDLREELAATEADLESVTSQVAALEQARSRAAAAALLVRDIDRSIDNGSAFAEPLGRMIEMASDDATLESTLSELQPYAESGVPTISALREGLVELLETSPTPDVAGSEWLGRTVENITGLVQVRSKDDEADVATGRLGDADAALRESDIAAAIENVEAVAAMPDVLDPEAAESWLADARARQTAVTAQAQLDAHIRELLTATVN